jgi:drug/metabolite transporter (DMT)-like permease
VSITLDVLAAVLAAAFLHASWNALVRGGSDPLKTSFAVAGGGALLCVPVALFLPLPAPASWPYLAVSGLVHVGYFVVLGLAYRKADLSVAYPLMRGGAPLFTTLLAISFFGDPVTTGGIAGVVLVSLGIVGLAGDALLKRGMTATTALIIATMIAIVVIYTLADGQGARLSGSVPSYIAWGFAFNAIMLAPFAIWQLKGDFRSLVREHAWRGLLGGGLSALSYGIALWAMTKAPIGVVAALRETSVLFAILMGAIFLKEPLGPVRVIAALLIVAGIAMMRLG